MSETPDKPGFGSGLFIGLLIGLAGSAMTGVITNAASTRPVQYTELSPATRPAVAFVKNDALDVSLIHYSWNTTWAKFEFSSHALRDVRYARLACHLTMADGTVQNIDTHSADRRRGDVELDTVDSGTLSGEPQAVTCRVDEVQ